MISHHCFQFWKETSSHFFQYSLFCHWASSVDKKIRETESGNPLYPLVFSSFRFVVVFALLLGGFLGKTLSTLFFLFCYKGETTQQPEVCVYSVRVPPSLRIFLFFSFYTIFFFLCLFYCARPCFSTSNCCVIIARMSALVNSVGFPDSSSFSLDAAPFFVIPFFLCIYSLHFTGSFLFFFLVR